jgi:hypothetical protein
MLRFSGHDINGNRHIGLLAESKGYKGQPEKGFYISNDAGSPWAYQVRPETVSPGIEINGKWYFDGDICKFYNHNVEYAGKVICNQITACFELWTNVIVGAYGEKATWKFIISKCGPIEIIGNKWDNQESEVAHE